MTTKPAAGMSEWWARPKCDEARAFDTGYCSATRPKNVGGVNPTDVQLERAGYFKVVSLEVFEAVRAERDDFEAAYGTVCGRELQTVKERDSMGRELEALRKAMDLGYVDCDLQDADRIRDARQNKK